jgi:hypothetical protein
MSGYTTLRPPRRFGRIMEAVCDQDRAYFLANPGERFYVRLLVPGELWPKVLPQNTAVLVRRLVLGQAGVLYRLPVPGRTVEEVCAVLADPQVTVFVPSIHGERLEALN